MSRVRVTGWGRGMGGSHEHIECVSDLKREPGSLGMTRPHRKSPMLVLLTATFSPEMALLRDPPIKLTESQKSLCLTGKVAIFALFHSHPTFF